MHVIFAQLGVPKSYLDLDCTHGFLVRAARVFGCSPALGQTTSAEVKRDAKRYASIVVKDARELVGQFELVTLFSGVAPRFLVGSLLAPDGHLVISTPFTNEKGLLEANGLRLDHDKTSNLQDAWHRADLNLLPQEVQVYIRA